MKKIIKNLTHIKQNEPLHAFSIFIILCLDVFILFNLFDGLEHQSKSIPSVQERFPSKIQRILADNVYEEEKISLLESFISSEIHWRRNRFDSYERIHNSCKPMYLHRKKIKENNYFVTQLKMYKQAKQNVRYSKKYSIETNEQNKKELNKLTNTIQQQSAYLEFWDEVKQLKMKYDFDKLIEKEKKIYALKTLGLQSIFILPLLFIFLYWHKKSSKKQREIQLFISTHLVIVSSIPIFIRLCDVIFKLIPRTFFKQFIDILQHFHLIAIWNYLLIIISIFVALLLIYLIQKKLFHKRRIMMNRFLKNRCIACGGKHNVEKKYCMHCGSLQTKKCKSCQSEIPYTADFCTQCGSKQEFVKAQDTE